MERSSTPTCGGKWVGKVAVDTLPVEMYIDYIRIYEKEP